jgi:hypothetical protein
VPGIPGDARGAHEASEITRNAGVRAIPGLQRRGESETPIDGRIHEPASGPCAREERRAGHQSELLSILRFLKKRLPNADRSSLAPTPEVWGPRSVRSSMEI